MVLQDERVGGSLASCGALAMELAGPLRFSVLHPLLFCLTSSRSTPSNLSCPMIPSVIGIICSYRGGLLVTSTSSQYSKDGKASLLIRSFNDRSLLDRS